MEPYRAFMVLLALVMISPAAALGTEGGTDPMILKELLPPARTPTFINMSEDTGLSGYRGDNLAWGDYNNDGYLDLLVRGPSSNYLFRNNGPPSWDFTDVSNETGVNISRGYSQWADYNADGYLDFYTAGDDDHLFRNNGPPNWGFTDVTSSAGNPSDGLPSEGIAWGDYDRDGYPDIYTVGWRKPGDLQMPYPGEMDRLYHNNKDGTFTDVSLSAGLHPRAESYAGMGVVWCDPNEDGWPDIYVSNYHLTPNELWINDRDGTFTESAVLYNLTGKKTYYQGSYYYGHSNGAGWADFDNDQDMDVWVSHLAHKDDERSGMNRGYYCADSQLFENSGPPYLEFTDIRVKAGIPITPSGTIVQDPDTGDYMWKDEDYFGVAWGDYDNDGDLDLWVPQVKTYSFWDHSFMWENDGDKTFSDRTDASNLKVWSNTGGTFVDYDNDGDLDFCTEGTYPYKGPRELHLFRNPGNSNHWLEFDLVGAGGLHQTSADATGTRVVIRSGDLTLTRYVGGDCGGHGFQQPRRLHFGLGSRSTVDEIWIYWTSGRIEKLSGMPVDARYTIEEPTTKEVVMTGPDLFEVTEDETFRIDITISGAAVSEMYWDLDSDRVFERTVTSEDLSLNFSEEGTKWLRFRVKDTYGTYWDLEPVVVKVSNEPPTIEMPANIELLEGDEYTFFPVVRDTPSDLLTMDYLWKGPSGVEEPGGPNRTMLFPLVGTYRIEVTATDDDGESASAATNVKVVNRQPSVNFTFSGDPVEGTRLTFNAVGYDSPADLEKLEYNFHSGDGRSSGWSKYTQASFSYEAGSYRPAVEIKDRFGDTDTAYIDLIIENFLPVITLTETDVVLNEDEEHQFEVTVFDLDIDLEDLEVRWDFGDGTETQWKKVFREKHTYTKAGDYTIVVTARDDDEESYPCTINVTVLDPPPIIEIDPVIGDSILEDSAYTFTGSVEENPSDEKYIEVRWDFGDGSFTEWSDGEITATHTYVSDGVFVVALFSRDGDQNEFNVTMEVTVKNVPPKTDLSVSRLSADMDEVLTFSAEGSSDTPSDKGNLQFEWTLDGITFWGPARIQHVYRSSGMKKVEIRTFDGTDHGAVKTATVNIRNPPPQLSLEAPESANVNEAVVFDASGTFDTPTDLPNLTFSFDPGDGSDIVSGSDPVFNHTYTQGGEFTAVLIVFDGESDVSLEHDIVIVESPSSGGSEKGNGALVLLIIVGAIAVILVVVLAMVLLLLKRKESTGPAPQGPYPPPTGTSIGPRPPAASLPPGPSPAPQPGLGGPGLPPAGNHSPPPPPMQPGT
ncbi:MAG: VCBS repeat-containing protein [Candidatus Thermoplasmatota archaeon]|nr:VCBS repeat-containing protein [Candidatus Thermoplasmatota archaeon]